MVEEIISDYDKFTRFGDLGGEIPSDENPVSVIAARRRWEDDPYIENLFAVKDSLGNDVPFAEVVRQANDLAKQDGQSLRSIYWKLTGDSDLPGDASTNGNYGQWYDVLNHLIMKGPKETLQYIKSYIEEMGNLSDISEEQARQLEKYVGFVAFMKEYKLIDTTVSDIPNELLQSLNTQHNSSDYMKYIEHMKKKFASEAMNDLKLIDDTLYDFIAYVEELCQEDIDKYPETIKLLEIVGQILKKGIVPYKKLAQYPHIKQYFDERLSYANAA